ncbi:MAG TPA: hypothetical protein VIA09_06815, partial [Nitrososphaeraceae archaeon]
MTKRSDIVDIITKTEKYLNVMGDSKSAEFLLSSEIIKAFQKAKTKGIKIRFITEINQANLGVC